MVKLTQIKIDEVIIDIAGKDGLRLVNELKGKENVSEFRLASRLRKDIKLVRNLLYKLYNYNLISSTRKKDKQKGWYIYYWTLIPENIKFIYLKNKKTVLLKLKEHLQKEQTEQFYTCSKKCVRLDFDQAIDFEFRCPECGELISHSQDPKRLTELQKRITKLEKELKSEERAGITPKKKTAKKKKTKLSKKGLEKLKISQKKKTIKKKRKTSPKTRKKKSKKLKFKKPKRIKKFKKVKAKKVKRIKKKLKKNV